MHRRRRLTLARLQPSTRASPGSGSRFSCLADEAVSDDGGGSSVAEDVAWQGLDDDPLVPPMELKPEMSQEEIMAEFWGKIGYPTPESRPWNKRRRHRLPRRYVLFCCLAGLTRWLGHLRRCGGWLVGWSTGPHHLLRWVFALLGRRGWVLGEDLCRDVGLLRCRCSGTSSTRCWRRERRSFQALPRWPPRRVRERPLLRRRRRAAPFHWLLRATISRPGFTSIACMLEIP
jgi:hypothetical protein